MPDFPALISGQRLATVGADTATTSATLIISPVISNQKSAWNTLIAATAFRSSELLIWFGNTSQIVTDYLVDFAIGAAGQEQIIVPDLHFSEGSFLRNMQTLNLPLAIPAGTRISARVQASGGSATIGLMVELIAGGFLARSALYRMDAYGINALDSGGTLVDPGATINTKPATFTTLTAATLGRHRQLIINFGLRQNSAVTSANWLVDFAIGAAGQEQIVAANLFLSTHSTGRAPFPIVTSLPCDLPPANRLSVRCQCSINDATDRLIDVIAYGVG